MNGLVRALNSPIISIALKAARAFRRLIQEPELIVHRVADAGIIPRFVELLKNNAQPELQFEIAWVLTNIAASTTQHVQLLMDAGIIPVLVDLLYTSKEYEVYEQVIWLVGNIAGECEKFRDELLNNDVTTPILELLKINEEVHFLRITNWMISNLCRGKNPLPDYRKIKVFLPLFKRLIKSSDNDILNDLCWTLSFICDGSRKQIRDVVACGFCPYLVDFLE